MLSYFTGARAIPIDDFASRFWLGSVRCVGFETMLASCHHSELGWGDCFGSAAGVECLSMYTCACSDAILLPKIQEVMRFEAPIATIHLVRTIGMLSFLAFNCAVCCVE